MFIQVPLDQKDWEANPELPVLGWLDPKETWGCQVWQEPQDTQVSRDTRGPKVKGETPDSKDPRGPMGCQAALD